MMLVGLGVAAFVANQRSVRAAVRARRVEWTRDLFAGRGDEDTVTLDPYLFAQKGEAWRDYVVELRIHASRGRCWFLGHIVPREKVVEWDKLELELPADRWSEVQVRTFEGAWEVSIDGGRWRAVVPVSPHGGDHGSFGFLVDPGGACEIKDVRVKVLSTSE
jgi:hypothetical protein